MSPHMWSHGCAAALQGRGPVSPVADCTPDLPPNLKVTPLLPGCANRAAGPSPKKALHYLPLILPCHLVFFTWTYWKSIFTIPQQPNQKFQLSYSDKERYEHEERPEVQKQMLIDIAKKLPVYTRTGSGGQFIESHLEKQISKNLKKAVTYIHRLICIPSTGVYH
ncbi:palmitoyltransferase ZDHHC15-like [Crocuta crocuta]